MTLGHEWTNVTPSMAIEYLTHAAPNRPLRKTRVAAYARDMESGNWQATGIPILFNSAGELVDGRHRLTALVDSGATINMLIIRGITNSAVDVVDTGIIRSFGDVLSIHGEHSYTTAKAIAALTKRCFLWDRGIYLQLGGTYGGLVTHKELGAFLEKHPEIRDRAEYTCNRSPSGVPSSVFAHCYSLFCDLDSDKAEEFTARWRDGVGLDAGSPILQLRDRIAAGTLGYSGLTKAGSWGNELKHALACRAWNIYREGRSVQKLQLPKTGLTNQNYPIPK